MVLRISMYKFKSQFSHKQLVLVNGPCFYRVLSFLTLPLLRYYPLSIFLNNFYLSPSVLLL